MRHFALWMFLEIFLSEPSEKHHFRFSVPLELSEKHRFRFAVPLELPEKHHFRFAAPLKAIKL